MGKFKQKIKNDWNTMWQEDNLGGTIGGLVGGLSSAIGAGITNAKIQDTSDEEAFIEGVGNQQFDSSSTDNLMASFDYVNGVARTNYTGDDLKALSTGQHLTNLGLSAAQGFIQGAGSGNLVLGGINAGLSALGSGIGWLTEKPRLQKKANELNRLAEDANKQYLNNFANAASNTQNKMFNNSLLNIAAYGGPLFNHGGDWSNGLTFINEGGTHEQNPLGGVPVGVDQEGTPNLVEEGEIIWNDYVFSNRLKPTKKQLETVGFDPKYEGYTFAKIVEDVQKASAENPLDKISTDTLNENLMYLMTMQEEIRMEKETKKNKFKYGGKFGNVFGGPGSEANLLTGTTDLVGSYIDALPWWSKALALPETKEIAKTVDTALNPPQETNTTMPWQSNLRYASPLIHGINLLSNLKKPDYSNADRIEAAARAIPGGSYTPLGNTLDLQLIDQNTLVNPIIANANATSRALQQGATDPRASLLANNYLTNNAIGDALIQGTQANNDIKAKKAQFYLTRDQANSQMGLQALEMDQQKAQNILAATAQAGELRSQLDAARSQAIGESLTGIADDLGSIGRESSDRYLMEKLIGSDALRWVKDKDKPTAKNGGMLTRNRRRK